MTRNFMNARLLVASALAAGFGAATLSASFVIRWDTIDGGGGVSAADDYVVSGTIGQPDAGTSTGSGYALLGGFWPGLGERAGALVGDLNCDGVVSVSDIGPFVLALTDATAYAQQYPNCDPMNADVNDDGFISLGDIGPFVGLLTGS